MYDIGLIWIKTQLKSLFNAYDATKLPSSNLVDNLLISSVEH